MAEWNYEKNGDLNPLELTAFSNRKVWWKCEKGHEWEAKIQNRSNGTNCPYCSGKQVLKGFNDLATLYPEVAKEWHPTKNTTLPSEYLPFSNKKVWWICDKGHEWEAVIGQRVNGTGCPYCSGNRILSGTNDLKTLFPEIAKEWHPTKNENLKPCDVAPQSHRKVWWKCEKGHEWQATIAHRVNGTGCPYCSNRVVLRGFNDLATLNPNLAKEWHPIKNGTLTPFDVTVGSDKKVWWICDKGHEWIASIDKRTKGTACPICAASKSTSFPEQAIYYYLKQLDSQTQNRSVIDEKYELDIYLPHLNTGIEYDGYYYHRGEKVKERDARKTKFFSKKGIRLIRIIEDQKVESTITVENDIIRFPVHGNYNYLDEVITKLIQHLFPSLSYDVNTKRDSISILELYKTEMHDKSLAVTHPDISKEWHPTKNGSLTPEMFTAGSREKVWWICDKGHEWRTLISDRTKNKSNCPYCSGLYPIKGENDLATVNPELAKEWHPTKNGELTPSDVKVGSSLKVWWVCNKGHEWQAVISKRTDGQNCPICGNKKLLQGFNDLQTLYPALSEEWHPTKNEDLTPSDVVIGSHKLVWWKCNKGHEWQAEVYRRVAGSGCPYCSGRVAISGENDLGTLRPDLAKEWHPTKNGDLTPSDVKISSGLSVWWLCEKGHEWKTHVASRSRGSGCPYCSGNKVLEGFNDLETRNPVLAEEWNYLKNGTLLPSSVSPSSNKKVWWKCKICGHEWQAIVGSRNRGRGCPVCAEEKRKQTRSKKKNEMKNLEFE